MLKKTVLVAAALLLFVAGSSIVSAEVLLEEGFESIPAGTGEAEALRMSPFGWVGTGGGQQWTLRLSNEKAYEGKYSMEIVVNPNNEPWGVHISSRPIPAEPGKEYTVTFQLFNVDDELYNQRTDLYLEFWPEGGWWGETDYWSLESWRTQLLGKWSGSNRIHAVAKSSPIGHWTEVTASAVAPPGTKYVTVSFWTSRRVVKSYIDNVRLEVR